MVFYVAKNVYDVLRLHKEIIRDERTEKSAECDLVSKTELEQTAITNFCAPLPVKNCRAPLPVTIL